MRPDRPPISADIDPYWGHAIRDRPIVAIDRVRFHGEPVAAVAAEDEATAARALLEIDVDYEELPVAGTRRRGDRRRTRRSSTRARCGRGSSTASASSRSATATSATATASSAARSRPPSRTPTSSSRASTSSPRVYQYAMETHTVIAAGRARRDHALGDLPAPVPRARRDRGAVRAAALVGARDRPVSGRRLRLEVVHEDGADHGRAGAQGAPAGAHPERGRRVDGDHAAPRHEGARAHGRDERRAPARARGRVLVRHRRLRRQRAARHRDGRRCRAGPVPLGVVPRRRRAASTRTPRPPAATAPSARRTCSGSARARSTRSPAAAASIRSSCAARTSACPARRSASAASRSTPTCRRRREGRRGRRLGRAEAAARRARRLGRACSPPARTPSRRRSCAWRPTAASRCSSGRPRWARARARPSRRSRPRCSGSRPRRSSCAAPTRASRRTTARPARAARPRSRAWP